MEYENKLVLAPMVRVGSLPLRLLAAEYGADITYGEEIIDHKLLKCERKVNEYIGSTDFVEKGTNNIVFRTCHEERNRVVFQMGTSDAVRALAAAQMVCKDVAAVDINMGCPKSFSISGGMGAALLAKPELIHDILTTLKRNLDIPITCKIRLLNSSADTVELARRIEKTGVSALAVHGRKVADRPRDPAKWSEIADIVTALSIPVIANGDVFEYGDIQRLRTATGASSVMVARGALWNASVFSPKGKLHWEDVKREYIRKSILWDNDVKSTKHTLKEIIMHHSCLELPEGKAVIKSESLADLACKCKGLRMELTSIKDAFDRVAKKQKLSSSKAQEVIDLIIREIEQTSVMTSSQPHIDHKIILSELKKRLHGIAPLSQLEGTQKELNMALSKYSKVLEKSLNPDISKAYRNVDFDTHTVNQIIASHFYRQGLFEIGDCFITDAGEPESAAAMRSLFHEMYQIVKAMGNQNLEPALNWAATNSDKLKQNGSDIQLKLHKLQFVEILKKGNKDEALNYARSNFSEFASTHLAEIQKLMGCLLWAGRLDVSPYTALLSPSNWDTVIKELTGQFCNLLGQSYESPLSVAVAAGIQGLPPLLKFMNVMLGKKQEWQTMKQLPVPVELDREFQYHSIFVCPVSKEQSSDDNPPMMMSCGHVLCKQSINKMSKNCSKTFKCPYCPSDIDANHCRQLYF